MFQTFGFKTKVALLSCLGLDGGWRFKDCSICKLWFWGCWFLFLIWNVSSRLNLTSLSIGNLSPRWIMLLDLPMPFLNLLAPEVTLVLSGGCFYFGYNFNNFNVDDYVYTWKNLAHNLASTNLLGIGYGTRRCL